jgi:aldehyde dehydrogenase (NAD+)
VVTSSNHLVGEELVISPLVDMISFTGSTATGRRIMEKGAATMKRLFLELGGKSAMVVLDDADFAATLPAIAQVCVHAGQGCAILTRLLLPRDRYQEGIAMVKAILQRIPYGDPNDKQNICGPVISARQRDRVMGYIEKGVAEGAELVLGGHCPSHLPKGYFIEPTMFANVNNTMSIAQEEIFGPVLVVIPHDGDDDAVRIANESNYGLNGGVYSASAERSVAVARRMRTGGIGINGGAAVGPDVPFGGYKSSGIGRQNGIEGFNQYLEVKSLALRI